MREWLGKPLLIVGMVMAMLVTGSVWYIRSGPSAARADSPPVVSAHQMEINRALADFDRDRR
jgi:hypothetical protein